MQELKPSPLLAITFVPVEALLTRTRHNARTVIVLVHVDEAVEALAVLPGGERDTQSMQPHGVAHQVDTIVSHRFFILQYGRAGSQCDSRR